MAELPYVREPHPIYDSMGGVPAIEEVRFSVTHNRGCFGACNFCSLAFHQGRMITSRSHESVIREVDRPDETPRLQGLHPRRGRPHRQLPPPFLPKAAQARACASTGPAWPPTPCPNLDADHADYLTAAAQAPGHPRHQEDLHPLGHPLRLSDAGQKRRVFRRPGQVPYLRPAQGGPGALRGPRSGRTWASPTSRPMRSSGTSTSGSTRNTAWTSILVPYLMSSHPGATLADAVRHGPVDQQDRPPAGAGAGLLPHPRHPGHLHVLHRPGPPDHEARLRPQNAPRERAPAGLAPVETPGKAPPGPGGPPPGRAGRTSSATAPTVSSAPTAPANPK